MSLDRIKKALGKVRSHQEVWVKGGYEALANQFEEEFSMNIVSVKYRFLRLNSNTLALVELYSFSNKPEVCQQLYPEAPYLTSSRLSLLKSVYVSDEELEEWREEQECEFRMAISEACNYPDIDYTDYVGKVRERIMFNYLDPLEDTFWDEYCPLFDNNYNFILRN